MSRQLLATGRLSDFPRRYAGPYLSFLLPQMSTEAMLKSSFEIHVGWQATQITSYLDSRATHLVVRESARVLSHPSDQILDTSGYCDVNLENGDISRKPTVVLRQEPFMGGHVHVGRMPRFVGPFPV